VREQARFLKHVSERAFMNRPKMLRILPDIPGNCAKARQPVESGDAAHESCLAAT